MRAAAGTAIPWASCSFASAGLLRNLEAFLRQLPFSKTISIGEPKRNQDYRNAHFPKRKADPVDSLACARFAIVERPAETPPTPPEFLTLRNLAAAIQSQRRQTTRSVNQLHNHLARVFPELAVLVSDLSAEWVLRLLDKYPTPRRIAAARATSLEQIPHVDHERALALQAAAQDSTGVLRGDLAEALVRHLVAAVQQSQRAERTLEKLLEEAFDALPAGGHPGTLHAEDVAFGLCRLEDQPTLRSRTRSRHHHAGDDSRIERREFRRGSKQHDSQH